ncbi:MAG: exo-alpha-sialidase, partial [Ktedonobacteraceae bacterium]|nr:exo-alpha-sialidase [Ktedonobacteraceae bacterium]
MNFRSIRFSRRHLLYCTCTTIATGAVLLGYRSPALAQPVASRPTNVQVSHDNYPTHAEPYLALNPRQPRNLLGAAMLMGPQHIPTLPGTFSSFDGGRTWQDTGPLPLPPNTNYGNDVTAAFNASGTAFVCSMCTVQNSDGSISRPDRGAYIWRSEDGGRSFHEPIAVIGGQFVDHPWLAVDRTPGPQGGKLYVSWKQDRPGPDFQQQIALS